MKRAIALALFLTVGLACCVVLGIIESREDGP